MHIQSTEQDSAGKDQDEQNQFLMDGIQDDPLRM
jgi:hypothetical protein